MYSCVQVHGVCTYVCVVDVYMYACMCISTARVRVCVCYTRMGMHGMHVRVVSFRVLPHSLLYFWKQKCLLLPGSHQLTPGIHLSMPSQSWYSCLDENRPHAWFLVGGTVWKGFRRCVTAGRTFVRERRGFNIKSAASQKKPTRPLWPSPQYLCLNVSNLQATFHS